ncbi:putative membrane protein [[Clostridium] bifermentans ATCC 638]|uniref:Putative membrane protein n=2 Tax=Paraclostridium bifermentans TaxID=1490 RepID=T4VQ38_PARBF|nr:putative membrane protein [[Clostridium] bifermentans ATCC 638] [Paraclostridium bifermentans ATCC 638 = DSM 14991]
MNIGDTIFYSTGFDLFGLGMNIVVIYYIIYVFNNIINKIVTR